LQIVTAWIGNSEIFTSKHNLMEEETDFDKATENLAESGVLEAQQPQVGFRNHSQEKQKPLLVKGLCLI
jgi:hypothetical protein